MLDGIIAVKERDARMALQVVKAIDIIQPMCIREFIYACNNVVDLVKCLLTHAGNYTKFRSGKRNDAQRRFGWFLA